MPGNEIIGKCRCLFYKVWSNGKYIYRSLLFESIRWEALCKINFWRFYATAATKSCSSKVAFCTYAQYPWKILKKEFIFGKTIGCRPVTMLKMNPFAGNFKWFWVQVQNSRMTTISVKHLPVAGSLIWLDLVML